MLFRRSVLFAITAAALLTAAPTAHASVSIALSLDELARASTTVARVTPLEHVSRWEEGRIVTYTRVRVDDVIAGAPARDAEMRIRTLGGVVDGVAQYVEGEPRLARGAPSIVFVAARGEHVLVTGRAQGQLAIAGETVRPLHVGVLVLRAPCRLPSALAGKHVTEARAEIVRTWEAVHAR